MSYNFRMYCRYPYFFTLFVFVTMCWCPAHVVLCFCFVFLRLVCSMLPEYLDCPFSIAPSVFSNIYLLKGDYVLIYDLNFGD